MSKASFVPWKLLYTRSVNKGDDVNASKKFHTLL